jgi:hypothetical protein
MKTRGWQEEEDRRQEEEDKRHANLLQRQREHLVSGVVALLHGLVGSGARLLPIVSYYIILYHLILYHIISYHIISYISAAISCYTSAQQSPAPAHWRECLLHPSGRTLAVVAQLHVVAKASTLVSSPKR